jgi:hypothetical protein
LEWQLVSSSPSSKTVVVEAIRGSCDEEQPPKVLQDGARVVVTLTVLRASGDCTDEGISWRPTVTLDAPLGQRPVVPGK